MPGNANLIRRRNNVSDTGTGPLNLVLAHGFGCDQRIWEPLLEVLQPPARIVRFDYVGCGASQRDAYDVRRYASLHGYKQDLLDIIDARQLHDVTLIGHSVSGAIGMLAAIDRPELFKQLILIGPSPCYLNDDNYHGGFTREDLLSLFRMMELNHFDWAGYLAPLAMNTPDRPEMANRLKQHLMDADPVISRQFAEVTFFADIRNKLDEVNVPCSILYCEHDAIVPLDAIRIFEQHLPVCRTLRLEASGHYPHMSYPDETARAVRYCLENPTWTTG
jgi:sigma-B regulation protein RsbQ